jgi:hypothetical protein
MNRQIVLAVRPSGLPKESDFQLVESPIRSPEAGELFIRTLYLSVDPYQRAAINERPAFGAPMPLQEVMPGGIVGQVIESRHPDFKRGEFVEGRLGWQELAISDGEGLRKVDPNLGPLSTALYVLGMPGMTAYFAFLEICQAKAGETVVVSGAGGAVGSLVGQIAKIKGCRAIGIAGSDEKIKALTTEFNFDGGFNYKTGPDYVARLKTLCPRGVDVYFDNVGGAISDAVLQVLNPRARIAVCGQISQYNLQAPEPGLRVLPILLACQARAEGFMVYQFADRFPEGIRQMSQWIKEGTLHYREHIIEGLENAPRAFIGMLTGENIGKQLVKVADPE